MFTKFNYGAFKDTLEDIKKSKITPIVSVDKLSFLEHKDRFKKIAWDMWHMVDESPTKIWLLQKLDDGVEYLCRASEWVEETTSTDSSPWQAKEDENVSTVTLSYKNIPVQKFSASDFGFDKETVNSFKEAVVSTMYDKDKTKQLLESLPEEYRTILINKFPELK
jgi:hypothetical protein